MIIKPVVAIQQKQINKHGVLTTQFARNSNLGGTKTADTPSVHRTQKTWLAAVEQHWRCYTTELSGEQPALNHL